MTPCSRIALHEAAHAVTGELISPGCMNYIDMQPSPELQYELAAAMGVGGVNAYVMWKEGSFTPATFAVVMYAPMWAEIRRRVDYRAHCAGDINQVRKFCSPGERSAGSKKAKAMVKQHWETILEVGRLADRSGRITWGDDIREVMRCAT